MGALGAGYEAPACAGTLNHGCWMCEESRDLALVLQVAGQKPRLIPAPPHSTPPTICLTRLCTQPPTLCKVFLTKYMMSRAYYTSNYVGITAGQLAGRPGGGEEGRGEGGTGKRVFFPQCVRSVSIGSRRRWRALLPRCSNAGQVAVWRPRAGLASSTEQGSHQRLCRHRYTLRKRHTSLQPEH